MRLHISKFLKNDKTHFKSSDFSCINSVTNFVFEKCLTKNFPNEICQGMYSKVLTKIL
jgi:hypothetical protein